MQRVVHLGVVSLVAAVCGAAIAGAAVGFSHQPSATRDATLRIDPNAWELGNLPTDSVSDDLWHWLSSGMAPAADPIDKGIAHERLADYWRLKNPTKADGERARAQYWGDRAVASRAVDANAWTLEGFANPASTREEEGMWNLVRQARRPTANDLERADVHSLLARSSG